MVGHSPATGFDQQPRAACRD